MTQTSSPVAKRLLEEIVWKLMQCPRCGSKNIRLGGTNKGELYWYCFEQIGCEDHRKSPTAHPTPAEALLAWHEEMR